MFLRHFALRLANLQSKRYYASREHLNFIKNVKKQQLQRPDGMGRKSDVEKVGLGGYLLLAVPITTLGLGLWQVQRKQWKESLIKTLETKMNMEPVALPENLDDLDKMEYETVLAEGHFLHDREMLLGPRSLIAPGQHDQGGGLFTQQQDSIGFHVITPFKLENREETILINRGWVPTSNKDSKTRPEGQPKGTVVVQGVVRHPESRPQFTPDHKGNMFFYRDVLKMAKQNDTMPIFLDASYNTTVRGGPIGGQTRVTLRNEHMSYIFTWFSLTAFTSWMWYTRIYKRARAI